MWGGLLLASLAAACGGAQPPAADNPTGAAPVDAAVVPSPDTVLAWPYQRELGADLDGDGSAERIVIASDVTADAAGRPLWEDGHRWGVVVEPAGRQRTLLYGAFVPNGFAEAAVLSAGEDGRRLLLVQERSPAQLRSFTIEYGGPGVVRTASAAYYQVERWLPGAASLQ